jgi:hypothetical protein
MVVYKSFNATTTSAMAAMELANCDFYNNGNDNI